MHDIKFQHTAARRRLVMEVCKPTHKDLVSTHSRPKAAGCSISIVFLSFKFQHTAARRRLALQKLPPYALLCFNTQPPEGGWRHSTLYYNPVNDVSTHSRPKAAGPFDTILYEPYQCFNTQPPEGGWLTHFFNTKFCSCFNTQPPEGGWLFLW